MFGGEDGCYRKKIRNFVAWAEPDPKTAFFRVFRVPFLCPAHSLQETVLPQTNGTDEKPRLWRCAFCSSGKSVTRNFEDQALEGYRKVVAWPSQKLKSFIYTHVEKFTDSKNASLFDLQRKITKLSRKNCFTTVASPGAWPSWIDARRQCVLLV